MSTSHSHDLVLGPIVVGVRPNQHPGVLSIGVQLAAGLSRRLVCVYVIPHPALVEWNITEETDFFGLPQSERDEIGGQRVEDMQRHLKEALMQTEVSWTLKVAYGDPARALSKVAGRLEAVLLVIGSHQKTTPKILDRFTQDSMVLRALRRQHVPVVLVPTTDATQKRTSVDP